MVLFLDLETTGTDVPLDSIIEVGLSLISTDPDTNYPEIGDFSSIVIPGDSSFIRMMDKKVVREMHQANGLLDEIIEAREYHALADSSYASERHTVKRVESQILVWLESIVGGDTTHIPLGGSGVTHFDRRFIKYFMPRFDARLTHWAYDMGVFRRMFLKAGVPPYSQEGKTHRALDDARVHADEFRYYQKFITLGGTIYGPAT